MLSGRAARNQTTLPFQPFSQPLDFHSGHRQDVSNLQVVKNRVSFPIPFLLPPNPTGRRLRDIPDSTNDNKPLLPFPLWRLHSSAFLSNLFLSAWPLGPPRDRNDHTLP